MTKKDVSGTKRTGTQERQTGPWDDPALAKMREWDPDWAETCLKMTTNPWSSDVLPRKLVELIGIALNAACTSLNPIGTRRHIRAALEVGATREEILLVLKMSSVMSIDSLSPGALILLEEVTMGALDAAGVGRARRLKKVGSATPAVDKMKGVGQWNEAWDPFFDLAPVWTDQFMATAIGIYASGLFPAKEIELLSIALDASYTHMYAPGMRRHIKNAIKAGATVEEIMEVLKLCVVQGVQACNLGVPILAEELANRSAGRTQP
jgi:alkylhydroperoxidase/carboxymuconolactone decarboxylase family protein YurZ